MPFVILIEHKNEILSTYVSSTRSIKKFIFYHKKKWYVVKIILTNKN